MRLFEINSHITEWALLTEDARTDFILKTYGTKLQDIQHDRSAQSKSPEEIVNQLTQADPTNNKQYLQWITKMYVQGLFRLEDTNRIKEHLMVFNNVKQQLPVDQRDIMRIRKLSDLYNITKQFEDKPVEQSNRQIKKQNKNEGVEYIINTPSFKALNILTEEAACLYGKGTQWCTAGDNNNQYDNYKQEGNLYVIIAGNRKFQLQMETDQFMNEQDEDISDNKADIEFLSNFPEYTKFLNWLIQKYYIGVN